MSFQAFDINYRRRSRSRRSIEAFASFVWLLAAGRGDRHADRKVVFIGDFVDRGPGIGEVIEIVCAMVDAGRCAGCHGQS